jgi:hypothetical protein
MLHRRSAGLGQDMHSVKDPVSIWALPLEYFSVGLVPRPPLLLWPLRGMGAPCVSSYSVIIECELELAYLCLVQELSYRAFAAVLLN